MAKKKKTPAGKKAGKMGRPVSQSTQDAFDLIAELPELADLAAAEDPLFRRVLEQLGGSLEDIVERDDTPMGRALDVLYDAQDDTPQRQAQAARKALKICPDCVEAHSLLGDLAASENDALELIGGPGKPP